MWMPLRSGDAWLSDVCPLYADLKGLCAAVSSVGTKDALLGDTVFLHAWSVAAGHEAELAVCPVGAQGFTLFPNGLAERASERMDGFLAGVVGWFKHRISTVPLSRRQRTYKGGL